MVIGVDIDNTITNTHIATMKYLQMYDKNCSNWHNLSLDKQKEFLMLYVDNIIREATLKDYVKEGFLELHKLGYKIVLITARNNEESPNVKRLTEETLNKWGLYYDKILFDDDLTDKKGERAKSLNVEIFIDDKEHNLDDVASYGIEGLRFDFRGDGKITSKYKTFNNWRDIIEYIKTKE